MAITIHADDGDELSVQAVQLCEEQTIVRLELHNNSYADECEFDWITLTLEQARALGHALTQAATVIIPYSVKTASVM
jgi:hypothetical protein